MKTFLATLIIIGCSSYAHSQYYLNLVHFRPSSDLGAAMKPTYSGEFGYSKSFTESKLRMNVSGTILAFKPKADTFLVYATVTGSDGSTIVRPGYEVIKRYVNVNLYGGLEWSPFDSKKFFPYLGFDILVGMNFNSLVTDYNTISHVEESSSVMCFGGRIKLGFEYELNDNFALMGHAGNTSWLLTSPVSIGSGYHFNLGLKYNIN